MDELTPRTRQVVADGQASSSKTWPLPESGDMTVKFAGVGDTVHDAPLFVVLANADCRVPTIIRAKHTEDVGQEESMAPSVGGAKVLLTCQAGSACGRRPAALATPTPTPPASTMTPASRSSAAALDQPGAPLDACLRNESRPAFGGGERLTTEVLQTPECPR